MSSLNSLSTQEQLERNIFPCSAARPASSLSPLLQHEQACGAAGPCRAGHVHLSLQLPGLQHVQCLHGSSAQLSSGVLEQPPPWTRIPAQSAHQQLHGVVHELYLGAAAPTASSRQKTMPGSSCTRSRGLSWNMTCRTLL